MTPAEQQATPFTPVEVGGSEYFSTFGIGIVRGTPVARTPAGLTYTADFGS
jgi:hypothetical protein